MLPFEFSKLLSIANQQSQRLLEALEINICRNLLNQDDCIHLSHVYFISAPKGQDVINNNCSNLHFSPQFALSCKSFFVAFRRELRNILLILELFTRVTILYGNEPTCLRFSFQNRNLFTNYSKPRVTRVLRVCQNIPSRAAIMAASLWIKISNNFGLTLHAWKKIYLGKCNDVLLLAISSADILLISN